MFNGTFAYYAEVPFNIRDGLWNYYAYGIPGGGFLQSAIEGDFFRAMTSADVFWSGKSFKDLAKWIIQYAPSGSYGSPENAKKWMEKTDEERREIMIEFHLRPSVIEILRGEQVA
jgi:hypothetical protein